MGYSYSHKGYQCLPSDCRIYISKDVQFNESKIRYPTLFSSNLNPIIADQSNPTPLTVLPTIPASSVVSQPYPYPLLLYNSNNLLIIPHLNLAFLLLPQLLLFHSCSPLHLYTYTPSNLVIPTSQNLPPAPPSLIPEPLQPVAPPQPSLSTPENTNPMCTRAKSGIVKPRLNPTLLLTHVEPRLTPYTAISNPTWFAALQSEYDALIEMGLRLCGISP